MPIRVWLVCGIVLVLSVGMEGNSYTQNLGGPIQDVVEHRSQGSINWTLGSIEATGVGIPPSFVGASASKALAARAARVVALRNLLEVVQGVRIDSSTTVESFLVTNDEVQARVTGLVENAHSIRQQVLSDGSVRVTVGMELWGKSSLLSSLSGKPDSKAFHGDSPSPHVNGNAYTGIIIDTRGLKVRPLAFPYFEDEEGIPVLKPERWITKPSRRRGGAQYFALPDSLPTSSLQFWRPVVEKQEVSSKMKRVGPRPLQVKGIGKTGIFQGNIVMSQKDARKIRGNEILLKALEEGRVIIITDPLIAGIEGRIHLNPFLYAWVGRTGS